MNIEELRQQRVLVVDDDTYMLALLQTVLADMVEVVVATDGASALEIARSHPQPDLILLDVSMPGMSGHEVCRRLKSDPLTRDIPVVFSTAASLDDDETIGFDLGAVDYITKPFRIPVVRARVRTHLETRLLYRQIRSHNQLLDEKVRERTRALEQALHSRRQAEDRFIFQVYHDPLTALPNRLLLQRRIHDLSSEPSGGSVTLLLVALSGFQEINNTLGYDNGSQLLRQVAYRLDQAAATLPGVVELEPASGRRSCLAVLAGVNFALLACGQPPQAVLEHGRRLLEALDEPFEFQGMSLSVNGNIGIAIAPDHGLDADQLLRHAHIAVEESASSNGRVTIYSEAIDRYSARRLSLMGELRSAIQHNDLELHFQPQLDLRDGRVVRLEALLRWRHPRLGLVPPDEFVPLAEQTGVIKPLTAWVLRAAIAQCRRLADQGFALELAVNLSARNLLEADLPAVIAALLGEFGVPGTRLVLEVTETAMMENAEAAMGILTQLRTFGVRSSIDDFGSGYSSLAYLRRLPVSEIKIDRGFVMDMLAQPDNALIVQTVVDMGHNLGLRVVAEGVEDAATLTELQRIGCDLAQGYLISRPLPSEWLVEWLASPPTATLLRDASG